MFNIVVISGEIIRIKNMYCVTPVLLLELIKTWNLSRFLRERKIWKVKRKLCCSFSVGSGGGGGIGGGVGEFFSEFISFPSRQSNFIFISVKQRGKWPLYCMITNNPLSSRDCTYSINYLCLPSINYSVKKQAISAPNSLLHLSHNRPTWAVFNHSEELTGEW